MNEHDSRKGAMHDEKWLAQRYVQCNDYANTSKRIWLLVEKLIKLN